jgi:hydroxymethylpyrimidine kinase/phosphomethylpyrimidine kinase
MSRGASRRGQGEHTIQPVVLTIAGSDSGGGAGIQADLKTFEALGVFGTSAVTCLTAQNPDGVRGVQAATPAMVESQIRAVCDGFPVRAAKTGMLYDARIVRAVARAVRAARIPNLVVDPVMVATSGARLLKDDAVDALKHALLPLATLVTPNLDEAAVLTGRSVRTRREMERAARTLGDAYGTAVVVKGGHLRRGLVNVLYGNGRLTQFSLERVRAAETHGTGCTFSAAVAARLALGDVMESAVRAAGSFVAAALAGARPAGAHAPLGFAAAGERALTNRR